MSLTVLRSTLMVMLCNALFITVFAQSNPSSSSAIILKDTEYKQVIYSDQSPNIYLAPSLPLDSVSLTAINGSEWELYYKPAAGVTGNDQLTIEYFLDENTTYPPRYMVVDIRISQTIILTGDDFGLADKNTSVAVELDVLENDSTSHGPLNLVSLALYSNGFAEITDTNTVLFTPNPDFEGEANVKYVVEDALGYRATGNVSINVVDAGNFPVHDTLHIASTLQSPAILHLPINGFVVDTNDVPALGSVEFISGAVAEFRPHNGQQGLDTFTLVKDGIYTRKVYAQVLLSDPQNGIAQDDNIFTAEDTPVSFNVFDNDLQDNHPIVAYTSYPGFSYDSSGWFTYTPPSWFSGVREFSYTIDNGFYQETASITIRVSDFDPNTGFTYYLKTHKNTGMVIQYGIPLEDFSFAVYSDASEGDLSVLPGLDTIDVACESVIGNYLIHYEPDTDFVGSDYFELEYCPSSNPCVIVKVNVEVVDFYQDPETCVCVYDCVWGGDTDNDGKVSVLDILPVGYYLGESGSVRDDSISDFTWFGESAADWGESQMANGNDLKHVDSDGDGIITEFDLDAINAYYSQSHTLTPPQQLDLKDYPFTLEFLQDTVYAGDLLQIAIHLGNQSYPAKDLNGFAFGLFIPPFLIDSASAAMYFEYDGWFTSNSGSLEMFQQPAEGVIEAAFTRTIQTPVSGFGKVAQLEFIIEEDLIGIKTGKTFELRPDMLFNMGLDDLGEAIAMPFESDAVIISLERPEQLPDFDPEQLLVYPNPALDILQLHLNGGHEIVNVDLFNMMGQRVISTHGVNANHLDLNVSNLMQGNYIAKIQSSGGQETRLVSISR